MSSILPTLNRIAHGVVGTITERRLLILIFHRVHRVTDELFDDEPDAARFDALLTMLRNSFRVMTLGSAVAALRDGSLPRRALAITFDDGYADNAVVALPLLQRHGLVATFFISTGFLDGADCMWNDALIEAVRVAPVPELDLHDLGLGLHPLRSMLDRRQLIGTVLGHAKYLPPAERDRFVSIVRCRAGDSRPSPALMMTSDQVRALHRAKMEIGGHTMHHPILSSLGLDACRQEINGGRERLESIVDAPVDVFAYPNGRPLQDYDRRHVELVKQLGFTAAVSTAPGAASARDDLFQLPRYTPWARSPAIWAARLFGNRLRTTCTTA